MKPSVLVIEDNEQNRYLATFLLEARGYEVDVALDGVSGIKTAKEKRYDIILLDIQLPGMDGYTVARSLRDDPSTRRIPIVAVTSYAMPGDRDKALSSGCDGYIEKPINPETFITEIERYVKFPPVNTHETNTDR